MAHLTKTLKHNTTHTLPMPREAQLALMAWMIEHHEELADVLAPYGISTESVEMPSFRLVCDGCDK